MKSYKGQASGEIEITPEMIEAGVEEFLTFRSDDLAVTSPRLMVECVLRSALEASIQVPVSRCSAAC